MAFVVWPLSLSIMFSRFIHVGACVSTSFCFYGWIIVYCIRWPHFVYRLVDMWVVSTFWLLRIILLWSYTRFCVAVFFISSRYMPKTELLDQINSMFDISRICQTIFQRCCSTLQSYQQWRVPISPRPGQHLLLLVFFYLVILIGVKWCLMALVFIFLVTNVVEHLFMCLLATSLEKCLFKFLGGLFYYWVVCILQIF